MTFVTYSQNFEDVVLERALRGVENGRYLDVGAQDPVVDSVSLVFYEAGWRGIHVEPTPAYASALRAARPDEQVIEALVSDEPGIGIVHQFAGTGLSTGVEEIAAGHREKGYEQTDITIPRVRLAEVLQLFGGADVHWMKVDVEGMEARALRSWGEHPARPWVLVIESTYPSTQIDTHRGWLDEVVGRGYDEVFFDGLSRYYLHREHPELREALSLPANVFDRFAIAEHHFAAHAIRSSAEHRQAHAIAALSAEHDDETARLNARKEDLTVQLQHVRAREQSVISERDEIAKRLAAADSHRALLEAQVGSALQERSELLHQLIASERASHKALESAWRDHRDKEQVLREHFSRILEDLRTDLRNVDGKFSACRAELARTEAQLAVCSRIAETTEQQLQAARADSWRGQEQVTAGTTLAQALLADRPSFWERISGRMRSRPAWRAMADWSQHSLSPTRARTLLQTIHVSSGAAEGTMQEMSSVQERNPYHRADSLSELLSWEDVNFVRCAYVTVLGRQPDAEGEAFYTDSLRRGHSKLEILWQLRRSKEAHTHDPGIAGFDRALKRAALARRPVLGFFTRLLTGAEGDSGVDRQLRAVANRQAVHQSEVLAVLAGCNAQVQRNFDEISTLRTQVEAISRGLIDLKTSPSGAAHSGGREPTSETSASEAIKPVADRLLSRIHPAGQTES
jgi:FkbM family methyltransferase